MNPKDKQADANRRADTRADTSKEMKEIQDSQASLVDALESIRGLLEQSETKLSAARKSLSASSPKTSSTLPQKNEPVVPILDDIVITESSETEHRKTVSTDDVLPLFADLQSHGETDMEMETPSEIKFGVADEVDDIPVMTDIPVVDQVAAEISEPCREELIEAIHTLRLELDDQLNYMMAKAMAELEIELRKTIDEKLTSLTSLIENK